MTTTAQADRELIEAIINDYHTARLTSDPVPHILSKPRTQKALAAYREAGAKAMQGLLGPKQRCPSCGTVFQYVHDVDAHLAALDPAQIVGGQP